MRGDSKDIIEAVAGAFAAAWIGEPAGLRKAATHIRTPAFGAQSDEIEIAMAFAALLERRAENKERILREVYGKVGEQK